MNVSIRAMAERDYEGALRLWQATPGIGLNESDGFEAIARFLFRNPGLSAVALRPDGTLVGTVLGGHDGRRGYLHHLAVLAEERGRGIARALIEHALSRLTELGIHKCNVFLFADNAEGRAFWEHNGWSVRRDLEVVQKRLTR